MASSGSRLMLNAEDSVMSIVVTSSESNSLKRKSESILTSGSSASKSEHIFSFIVIIVASYEQMPVRLRMFVILPADSLIGRQR